MSGAVNLVTHLAAHVGNVVPQLPRIARLRQDFTPADLERIANLHLAGDGPRTRQCLMFPGPRRFALIAKEAGEAGDQHPGFPVRAQRSEEHTSELQSLMRISYAVFCLKKKNK